jgi:hypothetical protein
VRTRRQERCTNDLRVIVLVGFGCAAQHGDGCERVFRFFSLVAAAACNERQAQSQALQSTQKPSRSNQKLRDSSENSGTLQPLEKPAPITAPDYPQASHHSGTKIIRKHVITW